MQFHPIPFTIVFTLGAATGCLATSGPSGADIAVGSRSQRLVASVGEQFSVTLGTVGPGEYESPPSISTDVVRFLGDSIVGPYVPAGERQAFGFAATAPGTAVVTFRHSGNNPTVVDTVEVR